MRAHLLHAVVAAMLALVASAVTTRTLIARQHSDPSFLVRAFACIHRYEGAWDDPNPPYFGGLQMDLTFQRTYGGEYLRAFGTADHWPPSLQIAVAIRAYLSGRGFWPWPNTARICGLL